LLDHRGSIGAAGAANAGASFARDLALSLRRATGWLPMRIVGDTSVARRKRSAPAKHPVRGADEASEVCSITVAQSGRLAPPTRVPHSLVALALSLRRATGCSPMRIVGDSPVARRKRSAPAKHPVRGADEASEVCSITVAQSGRLAPPTRVPLSLVTSLFRYAALRGARPCVSLVIHL